jgi:pimeloyl-ACP methyl ester carboxylesterase
VSTLDHRTTGGPADGPPVVLLHALGSSKQTWATFTRQLPRHAIALDLPGHGASPHTGDYTFTAMADAVLAFLDHNGLHEVDLVGHLDQDRLRDAASRPPSAAVVEIPVGHRVHSVAPDEFAAAVVPFLTRAERRGRWPTGRSGSPPAAPRSVS